MSNIIYRYEFTNDKQQDIRLEILLADTTALSSPTIVTIPYDAFVLDDGIKGSIKFPDDLYIGIPESGTLKLSANLKAITGDSDLDALRAGLISPVSTGTISFVHGATTGRAFSTQNVWMFYVDDVLVYVGVQNLPKSIPIDLDKLGPVIMEIELVDAATWVMQNIKTTDFSSHFLENSTSSSVYKTGKAQMELWSDEGHIYSITWNFGIVYYYKLTRFWYLLSTLCSQMWKGLLRNIDTAANLYIESEASSYHDGDLNATHLDHWVIADNMHVYNGNGVGSVAATDRWFIGKCEIGGTVVAGLMCIDEFNISKDNCILKWETVYDMVSDLTESAVAKGVFIYGVNGSDVPYAILKWQTAESQTLASTIALGADDFPEQPSIEIGFHRISGAKGAISGGTGTNSSDIGYRNSWATDNDSEFAVPPGFHNLPSIVWKADSSNYIIANGDTQLNVTASNRFQMDINTDHISFFTLFYEGDGAGLLTTNRMIRCNHRAYVNDGSYYWGDLPLGIMPPGVPTLPIFAPNEYFDLPNEDRKDWLLENWFDPLEIIMYYWQENFGVAWRGCEVISRKFGKTKQTSYQGELGLELIPPSQIGNKVDSTDFASGNIFIDGTYFGSLKGAPVVTGIDFDLSTGESEATLFAAGSGPS